VARTRALKPGFFKNDQLCSLPALTRLLFAGLWTLADREGRLLDRPKQIKAELFPYDALNVDKALGQLAESGFIVRYEVAGERCIVVRNWHRHQRPHPREEASTLPAPVDDKAGPRLTTGVNPRPDPEPDLGLPPAAPQPDLGAPPARPLTSSSVNPLTSSSVNSLREDPPTPQGGRSRRRRNGSVAFDEDGPRYEQRTGADGKREWVQVEQT